MRNPEWPCHVFFIGIVSSVLLSLSWKCKLDRRPCVIGERRSSASSARPVATARRLALPGLSGPEPLLGVGGRQGRAGARGCAILARRHETIGGMVDRR